MKHVLPALLCAVGLALVPAFAQTATSTVSKKAGSVKSKATTTGAKESAGSPVDLNTASEAELVAVPGIGPATAKKIIAGRPYSSVSDLSKAGVSAASIRKISPLVKASSPAASVPTPAAASAQSATVSSSAKHSSAKSPPAPAATAAPGGGPGMVWVNTDTKVFHQPGDKWYGRTKQGKYMKQSDAIAAGYRPAKQKAE